MKFDQKMMRLGLYTLVGLGLMQVFAQKTGLYWIWPDFDIPMHYWGGLWLGFVATWFVVRFKIINNLYSAGYLLMIGLVVLLVGAGWELFEYLVDGWLNTSMQPSKIDTYLDLIMDMLGGYTVGLWVLLNNRNKGLKYE